MSSIDFGEDNHPTAHGEIALDLHRKLVEIAVVRRHSTTSRDEYCQMVGSQARSQGEKVVP